MMDLILMGPGVTPDLVCDCADAASAAEVRTQPGAVRLSGLSAMSLRNLQQQFAQREGIDAAAVPHDLSIRNFRVLALDMDGTIIQNECIDDMAAACGQGEAVSAVTKAAMEGHLSFDESLRERVALLKDAPVSVIDTALKGIRLQPGAARLIDFCRSHGVDCYVVSGGFTHLTRPLAERLGMQGAVSNELVIENGRLTGGVTGPAGGRIINADGKRRAVEVICALHGCPLSAAVCAGDGANDLEMIQAAGLGVAFRAKPRVRAAARWAVSAAGLDGIMLLFAEAWA